MPFNRWTYYANQCEREAKECLAIARREKKEGETYPGRVQEMVKLARISWRCAMSYRIVAKG